MDESEKSIQMISRYKQVDNKIHMHKNMHVYMRVKLLRKSRGEIFFEKSIFFWQF